RPPGGRVLVYFYIPPSTCLSFRFLLQSWSGPPLSFLAAGLFTLFGGCAHPSCMLALSGSHIIHAKRNEVSSGR
ncbi:hypothetical protein K443DRAFT_638732, partial [Laccaria amethystina LaAM-08-1]